VLLAKETAGIDGISGGRLTLGLGVGYRDDDFVADGHGFGARGRRFDADLATYRQVWRGEPVAGTRLPAVPDGTREIPLLFGGLTPRALARAARWGHGFIAAIPSAQSAATSFDQARTAWRTAGRHEPPRLVAITYFGLSDPGAALAGTRYYYSFLGEHASIMTQDIPTTPAAVKATVTAFADIGTDHLIFLPGTDNIDDLRRLADSAL
jgi:alkanesulfonate monooxygenase SsuD/methylene tetrahydromethanopterin reductase-like flavin-dependent oxidoreductase (luciferase family)